MLFNDGNYALDIAPPEKPFFYAYIPVLMGINAKGAFLVESPFV
jgi:hypothetical protein